MLLRFCWLVLLFFLVVAFAQAQTLSIVSGNGQVLLEQFPSQPFTVVAKDGSGNPAPGVTVNFVLTQGNGRVQTPTVTTDMNGMASTIVISSSLEREQSFESETLTATGSGAVPASVNFELTTISSLGPAGPVQPGTVLLAPTTTTGTLVLTGASGATLPGAIQIAFVAGTGAMQGMPIPNIGIQIVPFDDYPLPAMCAAPAATALSNAQGIATCDLTITAAPGTYEFSINIGDLFTYRVFTLLVTQGQSCTYSLSATSQNVAATAGSGSVNVVTGMGCAWTAASNASWITISSGASGTGNGPVDFNIAANTTGAARSGTLTIAGQTYTISQSASATAGLSITSSATLPPATQNLPYSTSLAANGGTPGYTWSSTGALPAGLTLSAAGVISGTPTTAGVYSFTVVVTDSKGATAVLPVSLTVSTAGTQAFSFVNLSFPQAIVGQSYSQNVLTIGGCQSTTPFQASVSITEAGTLPPGLSFSSGPPAVIAGSATTVGTYPFSLSAKDFCGTTITQSYSIVVGTSAPPPAQFSAAPASLSFTYTVGSTQPPNQNITLSAASAGTAFTASVGNTTTWLVVDSGVSGTTPATITVGLTSGDAALAAGTYTSAVTISPVNGGTPLQIPVTLTVTSAPVLSAAPAALVFNLTTGGSSSSGQQTITVNSNGAAASFTAAASTATGTGWLSVTPTTGTTPGTLTVTANASGLVAGAYTGSIAIVLTDGPALSLPVALTVTGGPMLAINPTSLSFNAQTNLTPAPQAVTLTSGPPIGFDISISPASASSWLAVTAYTALTPATLNVAVNAAGLTPGMYSATVTISDPSNSSPPVTLPVSVNVVASPVISAVTNAASFQAGPVAPGELLVLFGAYLGPATLAPATSPLGDSLGGTSVLFDGSPGVMLYASAAQVAVIAPVELAGRASTQIQVQYQGLSPAVDVLVMDVNPAIFTTGTSGQGAIVNQDGTPNSVTSPAVNGSVVSIFSTGGGQTNPPIVDGVPASGAAALLMPASVQIDGIAAQVQYAGAAPGLVGLDQINVQIPTGVRTGVAVPVLLTVGTVTAPPVTLYIQAP